MDLSGLVYPELCCCLETFMPEVCFHLSSRSAPLNPDETLNCTSGRWQGNERGGIQGRVMRIAVDGSVTPVLSKEEVLEGFVDGPK